MTGNRGGKELRVLFLGIFLVLAIPRDAHAYIGPGAGFAVVGSFLVMFTAMLSGLFILLTWPIRWVIRAIRGRGVFAKSRVRRFVILGLDGLDPALTERFIAEGKLPNLEKLGKQGCFKRLGTTIPPISPVAWSSFQTGCNPGKHNICDFLTVDRRTYRPKLSSVDIRPPRMINLGKYRIPFGRADVRLLRKSKPFWKVLGDHGIFSNIIRVPITFPPERFYGLMLSAMCVPDLRGSQGTFSYYTTAEKGDGVHTGGERYHVVRQRGRIRADITGPENPFRKDNSVLKCPFVVSVGGDGSGAELRVGDGKYVLKRGVYSDWIKIDFKAAPGVKVSGVCRFLLLGTAEFELYVTPVNIDPERPVMPIAHPAVYSAYLAKRNGTFATLGLAEDTWALNEKILDDENFMQQCIQTDGEREKMLFDALDKLKRGLCVCVFDGTDRVQHTFWRYTDKEHPAYKENGRNPIEDVYKRMDELVGKSMARCERDDTIFMVISDHGFSSFRYGIDLNRWLEENGYLKVRDEQRDEKYLAAVDWEQTRAFSIGLAGIFINLKGRQARGIVEPGAEAARLRDEISDKLACLIDPGTGERTIREVYQACKIYRGPYKDDAADLIVGYNRGYRASWENAVGQVTTEVFHENKKAWSGDHCIDHTLVPGVLFCNRAIETDEPRLMDIGATVLDMFGIETPKYMDGTPLTIFDACEGRKDKANKVGK